MLHEDPIDLQVLAHQGAYLRASIRAWAPSSNRWGPPHSSSVKALANQTAKATDEIATQINAVRREIDGTVGAIDGIVDTINAINEIAASIASAVEEQNAATQEIARNVEQAVAGTQEVSSTITKVSDARAVQFSLTLTGKPGRDEG